MKKHILRCINMIISLFCAIIEAVMLATMQISQQIYEICERIEQRADHAVNETMLKIDRETYTSEDGFVHPEYEHI